MNTNLNTDKLAEAINYAEGVLDRTALTIGVKTDADSERDFRHCIAMAMRAIRHAITSGDGEAPTQQNVSIGTHPALEALRKLDFKLRTEGGRGLPVEACKIIDGALA